MEWHLSDDEIEELIRSGLNDAGPPEKHRSEKLLGSLDHLKRCEQCAARAKAIETFSDQLRRLQTPFEAAMKPNCPPEETWIEIASGAKRENRDRYLFHAAECDHCGPLLRDALSDLSPETPEEEDLIASLESAGAAWQSRMAERLAKRKRRRVFAAKRNLIMAGLLAASLLIVGSLIGMHELRPSADRMLATAYAQHRILELRIPGAPAASMQNKRGNEGSLISESPALLDSESLIANNLRKHPNDPYWLEMKGRAELLTWNYEASIASLNEALDHGSPGDAVLLDLATAYCEKGDATGNRMYYGTALENLGKVLDNNPDDEVALFNQALVLERLQLYRQALSVWKHYLKQHPGGSWSQEARRNEQRVEQIVQSGQSGENNIPQDPNDFVLATSNQSAFRSQVGSYVEDYIQLALQSWLPAAFSTIEPRPAKSNPAHARQAIDMLSSLTIEEHQDKFLADLVSASRSYAPGGAISSLASAIRDNHSGRNAEAMREAIRSEAEFKKRGIDAGLLRAEFEQAYAAQRLYLADTCLQTASTVAERSRARHYRWLEVQAVIELAFCHNEKGLIGKAADESRVAMNEARMFHYHDSFLRASLGAAGTDWEAGDVRQAWYLVGSGLGEYWAGRTTAARGAAFYTILDVISEYSRQSYLQSAVLREYIGMINPERDPAEAIMSWYRLGNTELALGHRSAAAEDFAQVGEILKRAPGNHALEDRKTLGMVGLAKVQFQMGQYNAALQILNSVEPELARMEESFTSMDFYVTRGQIETALGHSSEAQNAFLHAIHISEGALSTIHSTQDRMTWIHTFTPAYRGLVELDLQNGMTGRAFARWEKYRAIATHASGRGLQPKLAENADSAAGDGITNGSAVINMLGELNGRDGGANRIAFADLGGNLVAWVHSSRGISAVPISVNRSLLDREVDLFSRDCSDPLSNESDYRAEAQSIYRYLIEPLEGYLDSGASVIVEPDSIIERVPIEALIMPDGRYFGEHHSVIYSPGVFFQATSHAQVPISKRSRIVVVEGSISDPSLGILPDPSSAREAEDISRMFSRGYLLRDRTVDQRTVTTAIANSELFHYVGHSSTPSSVPALLTGFPRSGNGQQSLSAFDFYPMHLSRCQLVVLSGCSTSAGADNQWIDRDGMVLPFLSAGVPCVVASRWDVGGSATESMMRIFYSQLLSGKGALHSLAFAKDTLRSNPQTAHPYYWASFDLFGSCGANQ